MNAGNQPGSSTSIQKHIAAAIACLLAAAYGLL